MKRGKKARTNENKIEYFQRQTIRKGLSNNTIKILALDLTN